MTCKAQGALDRIADAQAAADRNRAELPISGVSRDLLEGFARMTDAEASAYGISGYMFRDFAGDLLVLLDRLKASAPTVSGAGDAPA